MDGLRRIEIPEGTIVGSNRRDSTSTFSGEAPSESTGGPLFHRERANRHLTELGRAMLPHIEQSYWAAQSARALAEAFKRGSGEMPITVAPVARIAGVAADITSIVAEQNGHHCPR